ncbi:MAG: sel1 repeat family protein [Gammaproteobacteria bacterium]|nr:sel1 repeat family protein [Gammaproteobacteria bacterium]
MEDRIKELKEKAKSGQANDLYEYGLALIMNEEADEGFKVLNEAMDKGSDEAKFFIALYYSNGLGGEEDYDKAISLFNELIDKKSAYGYKGIGDLYHYGEHFDKDFTKALKYYQDGVKKDIKDSFVCHYELGIMYKYGEGVERDQKESFKHFLKSNDGMFSLDSSLSLGMAYLYGMYGVNKDLEKAHDFLLEFLCSLSPKDANLKKEYDINIARCEDKEFLKKLDEDYKSYTE